MVHAIFFRFEISSTISVLLWHLNVSLTVFLNCAETLRFSFFNVLDIVCTKRSEFHWVHAGLTPPSPRPPHPPISPAAYFHGNKTIIPDIRLFLSYTRTTTRHSRGNTEACGSLQSRTRGIKNRDGCWIYKYGGGSQSLSLNRPSDQDSGRVTQGPDDSGCGTARVQTREGGVN